ncbi:ADP/ATP-dependent (S)-NAD(P)H-hydrate dehydratase [Microbacterium sp. BWT-B31]|uniref:ADP-dependent NAD(P)H-hydrate dehydratase n=1 Tax=Microbacterium sp. BWT-B31 TaxID=3232072 RepID=UPI0035298E5B
MIGTWTADDAARVLRLPTARDDKYSRGVVGFRTGSDEYPGAAVLGVEAAWRTGAGMVRYLGPAFARELVLRRRPETVTVEGRAQAWVVGSGTPAPAAEHETDAALRALLAGAVPVVVDAGALEAAVRATAPRVVTPHDREHAQLRRALGLAPADDGQREASALETAAALEAVVVLKGARTVVASPSGWARIVDSGTPWLATAGTGDVLAGVIGAVVAGAAASGAGADDRALGTDELAALAATGAWVHGRAGTAAAAGRGPSGGPITALDVAEALPGVVAQALAG